MTLTAGERHSGLARLRASLRVLYHGSSVRAQLFQLTVVVVDLAVIAFFVLSPALRDRPAFLSVDYSIAALLAADLIARGLASSHPGRWVRQPTVLVDIFILVTLLFPETLANLGFLRILRLWSISRSGFLYRPLARFGLDRWRDAIHAVINLVTFLFIVTGIVYTSFFRASSGLEGYVDALYFTVATVTTTGFGDITLPGSAGKLLSIATMIVGISLFVRLASAILHPYKVYFPCPRCALQRHDADAVHCKACGEYLKIPDEGL